jgi:NDP-sugar pyrophosphorylase family protein
VKAMVLAGGLSTRLYPLTKTVPKPLVPVMGQPNIAHVMRYLRGFGITEIVTNVFYFADDIKATLGDGSQFGVDLHYLDESALSGSAGAVKLTEKFLSDSDPFVVMGCDELTDLDLNAVVTFHQHNDAVATIGLVEKQDVREYGVVVLNDAGRIVGFQEKPAPGAELTRLVNTGVYVFSPEIFKRIPAGEVYDFGKQVFPELQGDGFPFFGYDARGAYWCDIGTPGEYRQVTVDLLTGRFRLPDVRIGYDALTQVAPDASVEGAVWIGSGTVVRSGARVVGPSAISDNVMIESGALIERSIVWQDSVIGSGATVSDSIIGTAYHVAPGVMLNTAIVANETETEQH